MNQTKPSKRFLVRFADGTQIGPLDKDAIRSMAKNGRLNPDDSISEEGSDKWLKAQHVKGLFDSPSPTRHDASIPLARPTPPLTLNEYRGRQQDEERPP